MKLNTPLSSPR